MDAGDVAGVVTVAAGLVVAAAVWWWRGGPYCPWCGARILGRHGCKKGRNAGRRFGL